jgi:hypothetical protein
LALKAGPQEEVLLKHPQEVGKAEVQRVGQGEVINPSGAPEPVPGCAINPQREPGPMVGLG